MAFVSRRGTALLATLAVLLFAFRQSSLPVPTQLSNVSRYITLPPLRSARRSCDRPSERYAGIAQGRWIPKPYVMTDERLEEEYGSRWWPCQRDWNPSWKTKPQDDQLKAERLHRRMLRIASYDWNNTATGSVLPWNGTELLVQALNSERGIIMIGDSLHKQAYDMLLTYLTVPRVGPAGEELFETELDKHGEYPQEFHSATRLREGTELFRRIQLALPHVPIERLRQPFITLVRNELLLGWDELDLMMKAMGKTDWVPDSGWWLYNASYTEYLPTKPARSWPGERNSIIFFNTGAHWSAHRLQQDSQDQADSLYSQMVNKMVSRLTQVPKLDIVYRSMTVPHFECWTASAPVYPAIVLDLNQPSASLPWSYGWTSFPKYDKYWADALDRAAPKGLSAQGGRVVFLNITEITGQRIDAHSLGEDLGDCLHWCVPAVPGHWLRMFAHVFTDREWGTKCS